MNIHHLELFYYVAKYRGISAAVRHIPYGIQQPAVSGQMKGLEDDLGVKLFERSPFRLTLAGEKLFAHIEPFFDNLGGVAASIREAVEPVLRVGGPEIVLRDHIPVVVQRVKRRFPKLRLALQTGYQTQLNDWLQDGQLDVALTPVTARPPARLRQLRLARIPLVLLTHRKVAYKSAAEFFRRKQIAEPLICLPAGTLITQNLQRELKRRGIVWPLAVEATSVEQITRYVASGNGAGVNIALDSVIKHRDVRVLPLEDFETFTLGALWRGELSPVARVFLEETQRYSREIWGPAACDDMLDPVRTSEPAE